MTRARIASTIAGTIGTLILAVIALATIVAIQIGAQP